MKSATRSFLIVVLLSGYDIGLDKNLGELIKRSSRRATHVHMASSDKEVMRKAETIMAQADKDGDGVVSFDEFVIVSKKFPNILFPAYSLGKKS